MLDYRALPDLLEHPFLLAFLLVANWPIYRWLVRTLFGGAPGLGEAIRYWFIPDLYSYFANRYFEDLWAELRLGVWLLASAACVVAEYALVAWFLDWWYAHVVCCGPSE